MTPIEIIALIIIVFSAIKILVLLVKPQAWMNFAKKIWANSGVTSVIALILAAIVLYYLIQGGMTIVQILAVTAFVALLMAVGLVRHVKGLISEYEKDIKAKTMWKKYWLYTLIWVALLAWGAYVLFLA